jgi:muramoyltetrapeptide carboxypeptidase
MKLIVFLIILSTTLVSINSLANDYNRVMLISSSTQYDEDKLNTIKQAFSQNGYLVNDKYLNQVVSDFGYVNTDKSRADTLINALLDKNTDILWFVRGGGGAFNLIPYLEPYKEKLKKSKPKIIVGFSDVTAIHYFVNSVLGWPSLHGVVASYNKEINGENHDKITVNDREPIPSIKRILTNGIAYQNLIPLNKLASKGTYGILLGGNFALIKAFFATKYESDDSNKILILEDVGVSFRALDRDLHQLLYKTPFNAKAIIFGQFYPLDPTDEQRLMYKTVIEKFAEKINKPVYYFPFFGHGRKNKPLILGQNASIQCSSAKNYCILKQKPLMQNHASRFTQYLTKKADLATLKGS